MGGLELQIGLAVVPQLTKLAKAADQFLVNGGSKQIAAFFAGGINSRASSAMRWAQSLRCSAPSRTPGMCCHRN